MKLTKIYLLILYQTVELLVNAKSDHVQIVGCLKEPHCLRSLNKHLLEIIMENMEWKTQPCEHFWRYACGSWTSAPYYDHMDNFGAIANFYADNLIATLNVLQFQDLQIENLLSQINKYLKACKLWKNVPLNMALYLKELPGKKIFGESFYWGAALFQDDIWQDFNWLRTAAWLRKYGFKDLFLQESAGDVNSNSPQPVVQLKIPHAKNNFENKYQVLQIMEKFNLILNTHDAKNYLLLADKIVKFDIKLQNLYQLHVHDNENYRISLQDLPSLSADIDWDLYFQLLLNQSPLPATTAIEFSGSFKYFADLENLFKQTAKTVQGTYFLLKFCQYLMDIRPLTTERECLLHTNVMFPLGVNYIYNRFLYKTRLEDEHILQFTFSMLKQEFKQILLENKLQLENVELDFLKEKLKLMKLRIGNLPVVLNETSINLHYSQIQLNAYNFYHNHLEMLKFRTWQQHQALIDYSLITGTLDTFYVNDDISQLRNAPYFMHKRNMITVPMMFLQLPFYHYSQHPVLQFSLVGWILAHELSHAFDSHGLVFDGWGNENEVGIKLSAKKTFQFAVQCLIEESPTVSLNERMADVNGLQLAYQAFFHHVSKNLNDSSWKRLFFINFAQFFCGSLPRAIGHDRDDVRVRQSVSNMREFPEVFQCSPLSKEHPSRKCNVWRK